MASGPWDYGTEVGAAQVLKQLSAYTSVVVRQEIRRAQLEGNIPARVRADRETLAGTGGLLVLLGVLLLVLAGTLGLAQLLSAWLAAILAGTVSLLVGGAILLGARRRAVRGDRPRALAEAEPDLANA